MSFHKTSNRSRKLYDRPPDMKVLLFNPPGKHIFSRDYFCSKVTKSGYCEHPVDLLILSGTLASEHNVSLLDAIVRGLGEEEVEREIDSIGPDVIIFLSGSSSFSEDFHLMARLKIKRPDTLLVGIGDIFRETSIIEKLDWLDAILLDFTTDDILHFLQKRYSGIRNMVYRQEGKIAACLPSETSRWYSIPIPQHHIFLGSPYHFPFARYHPYATVLTDFGCPHHCLFCIYGDLKFKQRPVTNVVDELHYLRKMSIREIFFKDQAFAEDRERALKLCSAMEEMGEFSWCCFMRVDSVDEILLRTMKRAGCHTIMFGVESSNEEILRRFQKKTIKTQIRHAFELCHAIGIKTLGTFILGFPGEDRSSCLDTIRFALELNCTYASFNIFMPKHATLLRDELLGENKLSEESPLDQSGILPFHSYANISSKSLLRLKKRAIASFYFRFSYMFRQLFGIKTLFELKMLFIRAFYLFFRQ